MNRFYIELDGADMPEVQVDALSVDAARDQAVVMLGGYLQEHPDFGHQKHWRVTVRDASRRQLMYVIVACVEAAPKLNLASYDGSWGA